MIGLPERVKVGGATYRIEVYDAKDAALDGKVGEALHHHRILKIDTSYGEREAARTLLHEIIHCVMIEWEAAEDDCLERITSTLESGFAAVWRDNPEVMAWVGEGLVGGDSCDS